MRIPLLVICAALTAAAAAESGADSVRADYEKDIRPLLDAYCAKCHGPEKKKGDINFGWIKTGGDALGIRELWKRCFDQLTAMEMPPEKERQPDAAERKRLLAWCKSVRHLEAPNPGDAVIRRLSRSEYTNTVRDLFAIDYKPTIDLPNDSPGESFDNSVSPLLMEKYLLAADDVIDRLIMTEQLQKHFVAGQMDAIKAGVPEAGKPDGKERTFSGPGEVTTLLEIPVEGTYTIKIKAGAEQAGVEPVRLGVRFDTQVVGEMKIVARAKSPAFYTCTAQLSPGKTRFSVVFMNPLAADAPVVAAPSAPAKPAEPGKPKPAPPGKNPETPKPTTPAPAPPKKPEPPAKPSAEPAPPAQRVVVIESIDLIGPPAKAATATQRRLFVATPGPDLGKRDAARKILEPFAYHAFRRQPYAEEIANLLKVFDLADGQDEAFNDSVKLMLKAVLVSPQFLFRTPEDRPGVSGNVIAIGDHELANRLSYFLWATMPDEELFQLARDGKLHEPFILEGQVRRLIKDPRSRALAENFAAPWLGLDQLAGAVVDQKKFPQMTKPLRDAMYEEAMVFFANLMQGEGSVLDLLDCDYTYMNALTAKLYGDETVKGLKMQRVSLADGNRGGLIGMPAVLMVTSRENRTSPVKRGKWVLETLFNAGPPPPPPDVAPLEKQNTPENAKLTLREKTERHRTDAACASCHRVMDPIGFGLENFDAIGRWRTMDDTGGFVDAIGELPGHQRFGTPAELKKILMARKDEFVRMFTARLLAFALGRRLSGYDEVVVDDLAEEAARNHYQLDTLIVKIVGSYPFVNRRAIH